MKQWRQAYSDSFIFLDRNRFTKSTNRKGGKKKHVREAVTAHFSWTWPLGSGPWAAISSHICVFRPPSIPNNRLGSWPYSRRLPLVQRPCQLPPCFCMYSTMITVFARKAFAFHPLFFADSAVWWIDVSGFSLPHRADRDSAHTQDIIAGWCKGAPAGTWVKRWLKIPQTWLGCKFNVSINFSYH